MSQSAVELTCPRCSRPTPVAAESFETPSDTRDPDGSRASLDLPDRIVDCIHCDRSFAAPAAKDSSGSTVQRPGALSPLRGSLSPTDVGVVTSALAAVIATAVFYAIAVYPLRGTYFSALFSERGWVPYAIALMSAWSGVILVMKYRLLQDQARSLDIELLPSESHDGIAPRDAPHLLAKLAEQSLGKTSFLVSRLSRALEHFGIRGSLSEVVDQLGQQSESDTAAVDASYTLVRTFIWAIPILGFIGTVLGIGGAVSGFSDSVSGAADLDVMKQSIGSVTTGLGVAFDTTLLALVMSIAVMFPASWMQKSERDFLMRIDRYCDDHLVRRLVPVEATAAGRPADRLAADVREVQGEFARLAATLRDLETRLSRLGRD